MRLDKADWRRRLQKLGLVLWCALWPLLIWAAVNPIKDRALRLLILGAVVGLWLGLGLLWKSKWTRGISIALAALLALILVLPGRQVNAAQLRRDYVAALSRYEGAPYVWGGEGLRGIDCSGLVRRGLIDADLRTGLTTLNPALLRAGCDLWWHDCSAKAMKEEYRHQTQLLLTTPSLNQLNYAALLPGDFAVTDSGVHTLAYIGNQTWIEADPGVWKVIKVKIPSKIAWFSQPMHIMRWRQFRTR